MRTSILVSLTSLAAGAAASASSGPKPWQPQQPVIGTSTLHGCYSSNIPFVKAAGVATFNSPGQCYSICTTKADKQYAVAALQGEQCWCGDKYPPKSRMVDTAECSEPCPGFTPSSCGNVKPERWTVLHLGVTLKVGSADDGAGSNTTDSFGQASESPSPSLTSSVGSTFVTESPTASASGGAAQTGGAGATTAPAASTTPTAGAGRTIVGGAAVAAMGMGVLNFL